jgi:hypothetical protein
MSHHCHATACRAPVPPAMFMCRPHWFSVPKRLRDEVWRTYREGQCDDKQPSADYCRAAKAAVIAVAEREGREPDTALYDLYLRSEGQPHGR